MDMKKSSEIQKLNKEFTSSYNRLMAITIDSNEVLENEVSLCNFKSFGYNAFFAVIDISDCYRKIISP